MFGKFVLLMVSMNFDFLSNAISILLGGLLLLAVQWILRKTHAGGKGVLRECWSRFRRPFVWAATEISEWRTVSKYRHRPLTWDDLPEASRDKVRLQDLSEPARRSMHISDLPEKEKRLLLNEFVLPELSENQHKGNLSKLDSRNRPTLRREVELSLQSDAPYISTKQDGIELPFTVEFKTPQEEVVYETMERIWFVGRNWQFVGNVLRQHSTIPGSQKFEIWATHLRFDDIWIFYDRQ